MSPLPQIVPHSVQPQVLAVLAVSGAPTARIDQITRSAILLKGTSSPLTPAAVNARKDTCELIESYFHFSSGLYQPGYSDQRIAQETGLSVCAVASMRHKRFKSLRKEQCSARKNSLDGFLSLCTQLKEDKSHIDAFAAYLKKIGGGSKRERMDLRNARDRYYKAVKEIKSALACSGLIDIVCAK